MPDSMQQTHFARRILQILFLAVFVALGAVAPMRLMAQTAQAKSEAAPSQEEQNNVFRLEGPVVKWTAKTLHQSPETAATLFEFINFGVVVLLLGVPLARVLPRLLRTRGEKVRNDLEAARKETALANARLGAIEAKLAGLDGEIAQIRAQVEEESKQDEARIHSTIKEESDRVVAAAEQEISSAAAQARRSLRHFAADLAITEAAKQLTFTPETDRALLAEFLGDAETTDQSGNGPAKKAARKGGRK